MTSMKLSEGIAALKGCLEMFGDVPFKFCESADGNPAVELQGVDTSTTSAMVPFHNAPDNGEPTDEELSAIDAWLESHFPSTPENGWGLN
jgi:hypothetical protein